MKKVIVMALAVIMVVGLAACSVSKKGNGIIVKSMGTEFHYEKSPERVVVLGYDSAEIMVKLGLEDKIISLATSEYDKSSLDAKTYKKIKDIKVLPDGNWPGVPNLETILAEEPDFVYGTGYSFSEKSCGKVDDFTNEGINLYATEGTVAENADIDAVYHDIENIGKIFGVEDKASKLVAEMKDKVKNVEAKVKDQEPVKAIILEGVSDRKIMLDGGVTFGSKMLERAGGENVFKELKDFFPTVSIEELITKNPSHIVVIDFPAAPAKDTIKSLEAIEELKDVNAVKNKSYIIVPSIQLFPSAQSVDGIERIAMSLHPDVFK